MRDSVSSSSVPDLQASCGNYDKERDSAWGELIVPIIKVQAKARVLKVLVINVFTAYGTDLAEK